MVQGPASSGRAWALFVLIALSTGCRGGEPCEGAEACRCFGNGTCLEGLSCLSNVCVNPDAMDGSAREDPGDSSAGGSAARSDAAAHGGDAATTGADGGGTDAMRDAGDRGPDAGRGDGGARDGGGGSVKQGEACKSSMQCATVDDPCLLPVCVSDKCTTATRAQGTPLEEQVSGDCKRAVCGAGGTPSTEADATDLPAEDGDPCTVSACDGDQPMQAPAAKGTPGPDSAQTAGDCQAIVCDGLGGLTVANDDADVPTAPTGDPCTMRVCSSGTPSTGNVPAGTPCGSDLVCDGSGSCVSCKPNGSACSASAECCGGRCFNGASCTDCPQNSGDCDGDTGNGCEAALNTNVDCGSCGHDCTGRPHVASATCSGSTCGVGRCETGYADIDGDFDNGCETAATFGPGGPYAPCDAATAASDCGVGELCGVVNIPSITTSLRACTDSDTNCFCGYPCLTGTECPVAPSGSGTNPICTPANGYCYLTCTDAGAICPDDMHCEQVGTILLSVDVCLGGP